MGLELKLLEVLQKLLSEKDAKDLNIDDIISKIQDQLKNEYIYRIPI